MASCLEAFWLAACLFVGTTGTVVLESFEDHPFRWQMPSQSNTFLVKASDSKQISADASANKDGHFMEMRYINNSTPSFLYSEPLQPSTSTCKVTFSAIIKKQENEEFFFCAMKQCRPEIKFSLCIFEKWFNSSKADGWVDYQVSVGQIKARFDLSFGTLLSHESSFVAIDNIAIKDCEPELPYDTACKPDEYRCEYTNKCIPSDKRCDHRADCECEEDEDEALCGTAYHSLAECDFSRDDCTWYNVNTSRELGADSSDSESSFKWTQANDSLHGAYLMVDMPEGRSSDFAVLRSGAYEPGHGFCQVKFSYKITSSGARLDLQQVEMGDGGSPWHTKNIWKAGTGSRSFEWRQKLLDVTSNAHSYLLQFVVKKGKRSTMAGKVAIRNITLSEDCLSRVPELSLATCFTTGRYGPNQTNCDDYYQTPGLVTVIGSGPMRGVQKVEILRSANYTLQAVGSSAGQVSAHNVPDSVLGSEITATFRVAKHETLYFLIGQEGPYICQKTENLSTPFCNGTLYTSDQGGGLGGGGSTIVYKMTGSKPEVLLIAAGGGGFHSGHHNSLETPGHGYARGADKLMTESEASAVLLQGHMAGSLGCRLLSPDGKAYAGAAGGFGGGKGGCQRGGDGGGGNASVGQVVDDHLGLPGRSYAHPSASLVSVEIAPEHSGGYVEMFTPLGCDCQFKCVWKMFYSREPSCIIPDGKLMDSIKNASEKDEPEDYKSIVIVVCTIGFTLISIIALVLYFKRPKLHHSFPASLKKFISLDCPCCHLRKRALGFGTHVLPQITRPPAVMQVNPHYDVVATKYPEQSLNEIPRKRLRLVSQLGQGAFGEVIFGYLSNVPMVDGDLSVAVKTLSSLSTEQAELDFLLEALIVSKFNHPNIVKFIGVCFETHPHYLILELLEGGDLKSFLRQARPKWEQPSSLTVLDLLRLSLDVARGCQHLEEKHFIHRDIAARNCLLTTKGPNRMAKIADFGMARDIYRSDYYKKAGKAMLPIKWMPPEAFLDGVFTTKTDVWSYGIMLWEVFSLGHIPYPGCSNEEVMNIVTKGVRLDSPPGCPSAIFDIMVSCWGTMAEERPNFTLIISILERTIQDDDTASRGLPVYYMPPVINTGGYEIQVHGQNPRTPSNARLASRTNSRTPNSRHARAKTDVDQVDEGGYLEPLLSHTAAQQSSSENFPFRTSRVGATTSNLSSAASFSCDKGGKGSAARGDGSVFMLKPLKKPRVFNKPGATPRSDHEHSDDEVKPVCLNCV